MAFFSVPLSRFNRWLLAQFLAGTSQWMDIFLVFSVPALAWDGSASDLAWLAVLFGAPALLISPWVGVVLDRGRPGGILVFAAGVRSMLGLAIAFVPHFELFALLVFAKGVASTLYWPASTIVTHRLLPEAKRLPFFSLQSLFDQVGKVATPLVLGALTWWVPLQKLFVLSGVVSAVCWALLPGLISGLDSPGPQRSAPRGRLWSDFVAGVAAVRHLDMELRASVVACVAVALLLAIYDPHLASYLHFRGLEPSVYGWVVSATALGSVCAAAWVRWGLFNAAPRRLLQWGCVLFWTAVTLTAGYLGAGSAAPVLAWLLCLWFVNGFGYELLHIGAAATLQNQCPAALLGRVGTLSRSMQLLATISGPSLGAAVIAFGGRTAPFFVSAVLAAALLIGLLRWNAPALR